MASNFLMFLFLLEVSLVSFDLEAAEIKTIRFGPTSSAGLDFSWPNGMTNAAAQVIDVENKSLGFISNIDCAFAGIPFESGGAMFIEANEKRRAEITDLLIKGEVPVYRTVTDALRRINPMPASHSTAPITFYRVERYSAKESAPFGHRPQTYWSVLISDQNNQELGWLRDHDLLIGDLISEKGPDTPMLSWHQLRLLKMLIESKQLKFFDTLEAAESCASHVAAVAPKPPQNSTH
jgi:hypothetical protein